MAKTAQTLVSDALRWIAVIDGEETATAAELVSGLDALNGMLFNFPPRGINYTHAALAATDNVNIPDAQLRNVMFLLGQELAPEYGVTLSDGRMGQVNTALVQLQAAYPQGTADNTALGVCMQAFRRLRLAVDGEGKAHPSLNWTFMTAAVSADALRVLNDMMFGFPARGINYTHSTLVAGDSLPIGTGNIRNLVLLLVKEFALSFGVTTPPALEVEVARAEQQLQATFPTGTIDNTAMGLCYQAFRKLRVIVDGEGKTHPSLNWATIVSTGSTEALRVLNDLLFSFPARGINYTHVTLIASDTVTIGAGNIRNTVLLLTREFAFHFGVTITPLLANEVALADQQLQAALPTGTIDNTAIGVCYQAFRKLKTAADGEGKVHPSLNWTTISLAAPTEALRILNDLMFALPSRGINYTHVSLAAGDALTIGTANVRALVLLLTKELGFHYGVTINPLLNSEVEKAEQQLQAALPIGTADSTALGMCYQAFRRLRTVVDGEGKAHPSLNWSFISLTGSADALRIFNDMMFGLPSRGINYTHSTLAAGDAVPIGAAHIRNLVLQLVREFAFHFGVTTDPRLDVEVIKAEQQLKAAFPPTMDSTVLGLINQALQRVRVIAGDGAGGPALPWYFVSATNATAAVRTFNDMMHGLGPRGIAYAHSTLEADDTVNLPDEQIRSLILLLVKEFANANGVLIPPQVAIDIDQAERQLQAAYFFPVEADTSAALGPRLFGTSSIRRLDH